MTAPTMDDHHRDAARFPACNCGAVWKQRGNLTGHCTACHQTFQGITLFDRHQTTDDHGRTHCKAGSEIRLGKAGHRLTLTDGVWIGPRMTPETIVARFGALSPGTERRSLTAQADETALTGQPDTPTDPEPAERAHSVTAERHPDTVAATTQDGRMPRKDR